MRHRSVAIVGLAKNTGKTECLNYILRHVKDAGRRVALTSIGIDGESLDQVSQTPKPEIKVYEDMVFVIAEVMDISTEQTSLGRLVTARAVSPGKVLLSGPAKAESARRLIEGMRRHSVDTTIVDGALSRLSIGSPTVTDAMILATGAALSCNIPQLTRMTKYVYDRIRLPQVAPELAKRLAPIESGVWAVDKDGEVRDLGIPSIFMAAGHKERLFQYGNTLYVAGVVSDNFMRFLRQQKNAAELTLVIRDFTKMFATMEAYYAYLKKGGRVEVLHSSKLLAVCVNPLAPNGYRLDSDELREAIQTSLGVPAYDVRKMDFN